MQNVRLRPGPIADDTPSGILEFDIFNAGQTTVGHIVIEVSVIEDRIVLERDEAIPHPLVRPFRLQGKTHLDAGYSMHYEMQLRNMSTLCSCLPLVRVLSARRLQPAEEGRRISVP